MDIEKHALALLIALAAVSCARETPRASTYAFAISVQADRDEPLAGVAVMRDGVALATTDQRGRASVRLSGSEGERIAVRIACPATHHSPDEPLTLVLRSYTSARESQTKVVCTPRVRRVALVVLAKNGANLPVISQGAELTRTDEHGVAHALLEGAPSDAFEVTLDTSSRPELRPAHPGARVSVGAEDTAFLLEPSLSIEPPKKRRKSAGLSPKRIQ